MFKINVKKIAVFFTALCMMAVIATPVITMAYTCTQLCVDSTTTTDVNEKTACEDYQASTINCPETTTGSTEGFDPWGGQSAGIKNIGLGATEPGAIAVSIVNLILGFLGIVAVIIILVGGFKWMTAGGNDDQVGEAKKWIYSGVIGLLIILAAYGLAKFAISQLYKATGGTATF